MLRIAYLAAAAILWWGQVLPVQAQQTEEATPAAEPSAETGDKSDKDVQITIDPDLDEEFTGVEIVLQIALATAEEGEVADLKTIELMAMSVAETDRQKAYVHLRIAELHYQRGNREAAIEALKRGLPLADGDRSPGTLYHRILTSLLMIYNELGRLNEAREYVEIYRQIISAGADPWERPSGSDDVIHKPSGIRLPHRLNLFTRERLIVFDATGRDAGATYKVQDGQFPEMTVYLVAEIGETAQALFEDAMGHILNRFKGAKVLSRGSFSVETDQGTVEGFAGRVNVPAAGYRLGLGSDLYVFVRQGTLIKFRITFRARNREKMEDVMRDIFKGFDWP